MVENTDFKDKTEAFDARKMQQWLTQPTEKRQNPPLYMLIDAARSTEIYPIISSAYNEYQCLFQGETAESLKDLAPYIMRLTHDSHFTDRMLSRSWGHSWGVFFTSSQDIEQLTKHFRKFTIVKSSKYKSLYFRFYDPRILRNFLPSCNAAELEQFFGPIDYFYVESEDKQSFLQFQYQADSQQLDIQEKSLKDFL